MVSLQSIMWVFLLNNFSHVINLLLTKLARDRPGRILTLGLICTDLTALGLYCQDLGPMFSQYGPRAGLIRYMHIMISIINVHYYTGHKKKCRPVVQGVDFLAVQVTFHSHSPNGQGSIDKSSFNYYVNFTTTALQAATILVAMASEKKNWRPKFWRKSPIGDQQIKRETYLKKYQ